MANAKARAIPKRLYRSCKNRIIAGVGGGIAEYFAVDPTVVRLGFVLITLLWFSGLILYLIGWLIIPLDPSCPEAKRR